jgi:hypothetical protein
MEEIPPALVGLTVPEITVAWLGFAFVGRTTAPFDASPEDV